MTQDTILFLLLALLSEIIGTVSGFGSSILFVPVASIFFDFKTVLGITAVFHVFSNLAKILLFRKGIDKSIALKLGIPAVLFVVIGALITTVIPGRNIELVMDIVLIIFSIYLLRNINKQLKQTNTNLIAGGSISGLLAGLVGTGGAIRGITLTAFNLPKDIFVATSAIIDLGVDFSRSVVYIANDYFPVHQVRLIPMLIVVSIAGSYLGKLILKRTSEHVFRYIVTGVVIATSIFQLIKYFSGSGGD
ncbi:MAG: hypothetical protein BGO69_03330 [Bacteroidetes bacterium 46-16]|nr:MAG: hypothetical protein BGO69_03330 [Bacteroidetes bacterium 46-16]